MGVFGAEVVPRLLHLLRQRVEVALEHPRAERDGRRRVDEHEAGQRIQ